MAPLSSKRRKLENGQPSSPSAHSSESYASDLEENPHDVGAKLQTQLPPVQTQGPASTKQTKDNDVSAIYAGGDYKSNLFKLQVDELLSEVQPNYEKRLSGVDELLRKLKGWIEGIGDRAAVSVSSPQLRDTCLIFNHQTRSPRLRVLYTGHTKLQFLSRIPNQLPTQHTK